jgi:hypothetical protein
MEQSQCCCHGLRFSAAGASDFSASFGSDPQHNFGGYRTYAWISDHPVEAILSGFPPR